jgi:hypothetical protein
MDKEKTWAELLAANSRRRHLAAALGAEPGGLVLAAVFREGAGAAISRDPAGGWRATYFDEHGFSGHHCFASKRDAVLDSLLSYQDTNRNLLRECMADSRFMAGVARSFEIERGLV